jgi:hypothetical protein
LSFNLQYDFSTIAVESQAKKTANYTGNGVSNGNGVMNGNGYHHEINGHNEILVQNGGH